MKKIKSLFAIILIMLIASPTLVLAEPPAKPSGDSNGGPGGNSSSSNVTHSGATTISKDTEESNKTYTSEVAEQNALYVSGGTSTINSCTINKTGSPTSHSDNYDFYGTNAAVFVNNGATLNIKGGTITTDASYGNAVFAYSTGVINISDATINTSSNNSGGVMVTGGGTLTANSCTVKTKGNSSAAIRSDRGGGTLTVNKGSYETNGTGSPVIYSTADIIVNDATLTSNVSEGVVVEGKNSVTLNNVTMEATNTKLNGNSETYKSIFIYQSMSGDADVGTSTFTAKNSKITNNKGDVIFVTNTNTVIELENNEIINNDSDGVFLKSTTAKWGTTGSNGGNVTLTMTNQKVSGDIIIDNISTLDLTLKDKSVLVGAIDNDNQAKKITLTMSNDSVLSLTKDTYVDSLTNDNSTNSNIYSNGKYKLYVNGKEVSISSDTYDSSSITTDTIDSTIIEDDTTNTQNNTIYYVIGIVGLLVFISIVLVIVIKKKNNNKEMN
ncbi:MAG: hypothetical protein IJ068_05035 [Bacilli bacterium]|nr:hypothetical protein [Bacilli bacterium]